MNWLHRAKAALSNKQNPLSAIFRGEVAVPPGRRLGFEALEPRWVLSHVAPGLVDAAQTYSGALNGKIVFTSPGHGWRWDSVDGRFETDDRVEYNEIIEPFGTQDQLTYYADYLLRAGATVVPMRPVGRQLNEVVLDNDSPGVTFTGAWSNSSSTRYYDEDYGASTDAVPYRFASTVTSGETATATYTPNIPQAGFYPVYTWVLRGTDRTNQLYRIHHTGGTTEIRVDHSKVGSGWVYLGTYHFNQGSSSSLGSVQISNNGLADDVVIADAIRFGNGMGDYIGLGAPTITGRPREEELSYYWIARMVGVGTSLATAIGSGTTNVSAPSNMAQYMFSGSYNAASNIADAVYIGIHSNGAGGHGARGLMTTDAPLRTPHQDDLALYLGRQINLDFRALDLEPAYETLFGAGWSWAAQSSHTGANQNFGEIDLGPSAEMDATIIEIAFHDTVADAQIMREPRGRDQFARSILQGTIEYFQNHGNNNLANTTTLPTAPTNVRAVSNVSGQVTINWSAGPNTPVGVYDSPATGVKIYASVDGYGFDGGTLISGGAATSATLSGYDPTRPYYFKVVAVNAGGESTASEVLTVLPSGGAKQVLIVNGFDRSDRSQNYRYSVPIYLTTTAGGSDGLTDHTWSRYNNSFDYVVHVHGAIHAARPGVHVASTSNEAVITGAVNLTDYDAVIWIAGEESTVDETFNSTEQTKVEQFIAAGGHLFVSGAEVAWDLDRNPGESTPDPTAADRAFFEGTLKANYVGDDAGTYNLAAAPAGSIFSGLGSFSFSNGSSFSSLDTNFYNADFPDIINPQAGAITALNYSGGLGGSAAVQAPGSGGRGNVVVMGFPFETITSATRRQEIMDRVLGFFNVSTAMPSIDIETLVNGLDADTPTGPVLNVGDSATFTYVVTNAGDVPLSTIVVTDNNGTPGNAADDFNPAFSGGDTNANNQLDVGETWTYTAARSVVAGQYTTTGTVTSVYNAVSYMDTDAANYFGAAPQINIESRVNSNDADSPPGPSLPVGSFAVFTYILTNTGNVPLSGVAVDDDNGTPGNPADDFAPSFSGGDTNSNSQLDVGETWTYSTLKSAAAGQYSSVATVTASGNSQPVMDSDATNYFGVFASIEIDSFIEGNDADSPPGPSLAVGSSATFTYVVSNSGNTSLSGVSVTDDNGTPLDGADDFVPGLASGDANGNELLDVGETWTFSAMRTVISGQQTHQATVIANDGELVEGDAGNYLGIVAANADFNRDGLVDLADFVVWLKSNGMTVAAGTLGDANYDTFVNNDDYTIWQQQFGTSTGTGGGGGGDTTAGDSATSDALVAPMAASTWPSSETPSTDIAANAYQDAAFAELGAGRVRIHAVMRPIATTHRRLVLRADGSNLPAILAELSERRLRRDDIDGSDPEVRSDDLREVTPVAFDEALDLRRARLLPHVRLL